MGESFERAIQEHLALKRRNSHLDQALPLSAYLGEQGVVDVEAGNEGAAFDTAEWKGKRRPAQPGQGSRRKPESVLESLEDVWSSGPVFDWGDDRGA